MGNIPILKAADNLCHRIHLTDMLQELVAQALTLGGTLHQAGNIHKAESCRSGLLGVIHLMQHLQPLVRHINDAHIRLNGAERIICRLGTCLGNGVKQCAFAHIRQSYNTYF